MRLINVHTLELKEFFDAEIPKYAILSHTWGKGKDEVEVTFQDYCWLADYDKNRTTYASLQDLLPQIGQNMQAHADSIRQRSGYDKIVQSARLAKEWGQDYVWVDTCCIDKTSSTELSEALNSMFRWYERSIVCFAFLSDVIWTGDNQTGVRFEDSRWFTRGFTLQELLAPRKVWFYDRQWAKIGERNPMADRLHKITGIPISALRRNGWYGMLEKGDFPLAERMSWVSKRETSRKEDIAYCLLGLFDINMPLLYGEGEKAFVRLQQEIIKNSCGQSLLAWGMDRPLATDPLYSPYPPSTLLAPSPAAFAGSNVKVLDNSGTHGVPFHLNNRGLEISLDLFGLNMPGIVYAKWDVTFKHHNNEDGDRFCLCIPMFLVGYRHGITKRDLDKCHEMMKCECPVPVENSRLPTLWRRKMTLVVEHHQRTEWADGFRYIDFPVTFPIQGTPHAKMVESFPPVFNDGRYCMDVTGGVLLFRFVVSDAHAANFSANGRPVEQFVVAVDIEADEQGLELGEEGFETSSTSVCAWTGYVGQETGRDEGPYVSLVDAFLGEEELLDMSQWTDDRIMYRGRVLKVGVTAWRNSEGRTYAHMLFTPTAPS